MECVHNIVQVRAVFKISYFQLAAKDGPFMTCRQIVEYNYVMTTFTKGIYDVAADIAGSTGHKDLHVSFFPSSQKIQPDRA
jgi:hypothetical protein